MKASNISAYNKRDDLYKATNNANGFRKVFELSGANVLFTRNVFDNIFDSFNSHLQSLLKFIVQFFHRPLASNRQVWAAYNNVCVLN